MKCSACEKEISLWSCYLDDDGYICSDCARGRIDRRYGEPPICDCGARVAYSKAEAKSIRVHALWCQFREWKEKRGER